MLNRLINSLNGLGNPFACIHKRFSRYVAIISCTGTVSFLIAWALLHFGCGPMVTLVVSATISGLVNYMAMELWAFPDRRGRLSWRRMWGNTLIGISGFSARYLVLTAALKHLVLPSPWNTFVPLLLAYLTSFLVGYLLRTIVVFRKNPTSRRLKASPSGRTTPAPTSGRNSPDPA